MTATALAFDTPLDFFDDVDVLVPRRPELRLIQGGGYGAVVPDRVPQSVPAAASVEVYRRRRFLALMAATVLVLAIAWAAGVSVLSFGANAAAPTVDAIPAVHVVLPGDSYAAIAADLGVANPVAAAQQIRAANGGSELIVGQRLVVDLTSFSPAG